MKEGSLKAGDILQIFLPAQDSCMWLNQDVVLIDRYVPFTAASYWQLYAQHTHSMCRLVWHLVYVIYTVLWDIW